MTEKKITTKDTKDTKEINTLIEKPAENEFYTLGRWNGMTQWKCKFCAWDTLEGEGELMKHYYERHAPPEPPAPARKILRSDRWGNPVEDT